jgi:heptosyltransferase-3
MTFPLNLSTQTLLNDINPLNAHGFCHRIKIMKILIIRPGALGDTLLLIPALAQIRGHAEITLAARMPGLEYLRPFAHECMDYESTGWHRLYIDDPSPWAKPVFPHTELAVAFLNDRMGKVADNLRAFMPQASIHVFPSSPRQEENVHAAFYLAKCMERSGCPLSARRALEEAVRRPLLGDDALPEAGKRIVVHPGSGGIAKNHPIDFWMTMLQAFKYRLSPGRSAFVLLLGPAEESFLSFYRQRFCDDGTEIIFSPEREILTELLRSAPLYLGHDSGITHLAAMLGTPTIALFRSSRVDQWRPLGPRVKVMEEKESSLVLIEEVCKAAREFICQFHGRS